MKISPDGPIKLPPITKPPVVPIPFDGRRRLRDWISGFLDYTEQQESPAEYLRWVALATIAGAAQRKINMDMEYYYVMSNMYVTLVGPPGSKKTTAIRQGRKLLNKIPGVNLSSDAPSVVGLMDDFAEVSKANPAHQSLNGFIYELSSLFENAERTMTGFLTTIYDGDDDYIKKTRVGGKEHIAFPWLNIVAGTTPSYLGDTLSKSAIEGGYVARNIYVFSDEIILKTPRPKKSPALEKLKEDLTHDLATISNISGQFGFVGGDEGEAAQWYDSWYLDRSRFPRITDNRTAGYFTRKPQHLLKVAMAVSLAKGNGLVLSLEELQIARALLEDVEPGMLRAFSAVGGNEYATDIERVRAQIRQSGTPGISYTELWLANSHSIEQRMFDATLASICAMGDARQGMCQLKLADGSTRNDRHFVAIVSENGDGQVLQRVNP